MDLDQLINSEADIAGLIGAYRRAVHGSAETAAEIVEQYPELRQPVAVTRELAAKNPKLGLELENLAVEGMAENGFTVLEKKAAAHPPHSAEGLWPRLTVESGDNAEVVVKPVDFSRVINSADDIRHLVAAYRLALHGGEAVAQKVFDGFPELRELVKRTQACAEGADSLAPWEEIGVEALVERGLRTLEEKGRSPFDSSEPVPER